MVGLASGMPSKNICSVNGRHRHQRILGTIGRCDDGTDNLSAPWSRTLISYTTLIKMECVTVFESWIYGYGIMGMGTMLCESLCVGVNTIQAHLMYQCIIFTSSRKKRRHTSFIDATYLLNSYCYFWRRWVLDMTHPNLVIDAGLTGCGCIRTFFNLWHVEIKVEIKKCLA